MYINLKHDYKKKHKLVKTLFALTITSFIVTGCTKEANSITVETSVVEEESTLEDLQTQSLEHQDVSSNQINNDLNNVVNDVVVVNEPDEVKEKKVVALTFDDGPSKYTSELVDILNENGATATFFLIGNNINNYPDSVVKAYTSGNEIAVHSLTHTAFTKMTIEDIKSEIDTTRAMLNDIDVDYSNLVRPPYGSINDDIVNNVDTSFILWSVDTEDWSSRDKDAVKEEVYANISDGSIMLFHDLYPSTLEAISEILPELSDEYEFVSVSELFEKKEKELEPNNKYYYVKE